MTRLRLLTCRHLALRHLVLALALLVPVACGELTEVEPEDDPDAMAGVEQAEREAAATTGRDLTRVDMCAMLSAEEVAEITGGVESGLARRQDLGESQGCAYGMSGEVGGASADRLAIWARPPGMFEDEETLLETAQALGDEVRIEPVVGVGEHAFLLANDTREAYTVHVLVEGDLAFMATADAPENAVAMAQIALGRLGATAPAAEDAVGFPAAADGA